MTGMGERKATGNVDAPDSRLLARDTLDSRRHRGGLHGGWTVDMEGGYREGTRAHPPRIGCIRNRARGLHRTNRPVGWMVEHHGLLGEGGEGNLPTFFVQCTNGREDK